MSRMTGGTNSVAMMTAKAIFLPRKSTRASAYAAMEAVTRMTRVCAVAATTLLSSHRTTGVPSVAKIDR
nr:hypothetical protein DA06_27390 [Georgenia sp. SUBG003]